MRATIFERAGGFARVRLMVSEFYDRILQSDRLRPYFEGVDVRRLIDHQTKFVSALMGGPASFSDEQIARAHRHLGVTGEAFDEMAVLFRETLEDFGLPPADVARVEAQMLTLREHVVRAASLEVS